MTYTWEKMFYEELRALCEAAAEPVPDDVLEDLTNVLKAKHHDYGEDNLREFGEFGILVRVSDKVARLKNLLKVDGEVKDETIEDTWRDIAGYAIQALILRREACGEDEAEHETRADRIRAGKCPDCGSGFMVYRISTVQEDGVTCTNPVCGFFVAIAAEEFKNWDRLKEKLIRELA